jgi:hypothetical protein
MKAERYMQEYMEQHNISYDKVKKDTGIDVRRIFYSEKNMLADDFLRLCIYLGIAPEEVSDQIL